MKFINNQEVNIHLSLTFLSKGIALHINLIKKKKNIDDTKNTGDIMIHDTKPN